MDQYSPTFLTKTVSLYPTNHNLIFNSLRRREQNFDVEIEITGVETVTTFKAHSQVLLMSSSEFFETVFSDRWNVDEKPEVLPKQLKVVKIGAEHANPAFFKEILNFLYTGSIVLRPANIQAVLETSHFLQLTHLFNHAQTYFEQMLTEKPEVETCQIYHHIAVAYQEGNVTNLSQFGEKLYAFQSTSGQLMIVVKSVPDNRWMFVDSVKFLQAKILFDDSDVYLCDKNYIILHQTPTGSLFSLAVTLGVLYYSGAIDEKIYLCGSEPFGSQCFDIQTRMFIEFPLPARGVNGIANLVSSKNKMIIVADNEYLSIAEPTVSKEWKEYMIPKKSNMINLPFVRIGLGFPKVLFYGLDGIVENKDTRNGLVFDTETLVFDEINDYDEYSSDSESSVDSWGYKKKGRKYWNRR